jgi:hypothetical protein
VASAGTAPTTSSGVSRTGAADVSATVAAPTGSETSQRPGRGGPTTGPGR